MANLKTDVALIVTLVVIGAAIVLGGYMLYDIDADAETWKRYAYLLTGVEAIVFASVGWLFGKEVHREQAETAEQGRGLAEEKARQATEQAGREAEKGRGLARAVIAAARGQESETLEAAPANGQTRISALTPRMDALVDHARSAYQDL